MRAARSEEAAEVKEPGFAPAYARFVVKRTCCAFWLSLTVTLLLSAVGIMIAMEDAQAKGQSSILSITSLALRQLLVHNKKFFSPKFIPTLEHLT